MEHCGPTSLKAQDRSMTDSCSFCSRCKRWKGIEHFFSREDNTGSYAWCKTCMEKEGRSTDYPDLSQRGHGVVFSNYGSLKATYLA